MRKTLLVAAGAFGLVMVQAKSADFSKGKIDVIVKATTSQYWGTAFDDACAARKRSECRSQR